MKLSIRLFVFAMLSLMLTTAASAATWYVRADGGTRYSPNAQNGQCDGLADAAYPGSGVDQHCAFNDVRFLWDDQHTYNTLQWVIAGGDTVILDNTQQWRIGWNGDGTSPSTEPWCWGWNGGPYGCYNPTVPAGTANQHTRILGRNYASCNAGNQGDTTKMTQLFGGHGVGAVLNLTGAQYVDVQCVELTRHSNCIVHGSPAYPSQCSSSVPIDDYDSDGIYTDQNTHDVLLQDMWIHGHTDRGIIGPIGGTVTANRIDIAYNGMAGWDFDNGNGTPNINGVLHMSYSKIEWSGCNQEFPAVDPYPVASCYSQSTGGYGDGIGTPANDSMSVFIDHSIFRYNTQDGEDFGHIDTGTNTLQITDSMSYANNGGQFKWGPAFTSVLFENNLAVGNCLRMSQPISGAPSTYNANLSDFCRAEDALSFNFVNNANALFANNTIVTYAPTTFDMQCVGTNCANSVFTLTNNIVLGYANPTTYTMGGQTGGVGGYCGAGCNNSTALIGTINRKNNIYYGVRGSCIANQPTGDSINGTATGEFCADPQFNGEPASFVDEATLDGFNFSLSSGSPAINAGAVVAGLTTDFNGISFHVPPTVGALEDSSSVTTANVGSTWPVLGGALSTSTSGSASPTTTTPASGAGTGASSGSNSSSGSSTTGSSSSSSSSTGNSPSSGTPSSGSGSSSSSGSTSSTGSNPKTTTPAATTTTLAGTTYKKVTQNVTVTATVQALAGGSVPNGTVVLTANGMRVGTAKLNGGGVATWKVPAVVEYVGMTVTYQGNSKFAASTSSTVTIQ